MRVVPVDPNPLANEASSLARNRVSIAPAPEWTPPADYSRDVPSQPGHPITILLLRKHVHAKRHEHYTQNAIRLETMEAVQTQSQWRLEFDPRQQSVVIHWIRVRRGPAVTERASLDRFRVFQREDQLDACVLHGWLTLLVVP